MILTALRPAYLPSVEYFWQAAQCNIVVFADHLQFTKGTNINRSAPLHTAEDVLTIPVRHLKQQQTIAQKSIDDHLPWRQKHMKTLKHLFHNFPFAYYYLPQMEEILNEEWRNLGDFLWHTTNKLVEWLRLPVKLVRSSELGATGNSEELIVRWCEEFDTQIYMASEEAFNKKWVQKEELKKQGIQCYVFKPIPESHLMQNFAGLSALHFLLQFGPEAGYIIRQYLSFRYSVV